MKLIEIFQILNWKQIGRITYDGIDNSDSFDYEYRLIEIGDDNYLKDLQAFVEKYGDKSVVTIEANGDLILDNGYYDCAYYLEIEIMD